MSYNISDLFSSEFEVIDDYPKVKILYQNKNGIEEEKVVLENYSERTLFDIMAECQLTYSKNMEDE